MWFSMHADPEMESQGRRLELTFHRKQSFKSGLCRATIAHVRKRTQLGQQTTLCIPTIVISLSNTHVLSDSDHVFVMQRCCASGMAFNVRGTGLHPLIGESRMRLGDEDSGIFNSPLNADAHSLAFRLLYAGPENGDTIPSCQIGQEYNQSVHQQPCDSSIP